MQLVVAALVLDERYRSSDCAHAVFRLGGLRTRAHHTSGTPRDSRQAGRGWHCATPQDTRRPIRTLNLTIMLNAMQSLHVCYARNGL